MLLQYLPCLKKTCVRQVVLDKYSVRQVVPPDLVFRGSRTMPFRISVPYLQGLSPRNSQVGDSPWVALLV